MPDRNEKYKSLDNISKTDRDLLIIAQAGVVNYEQLWMTGFHGKSMEAYRVAVQALKEKGLIETFFFKNRRIAIVLTSKGREHVKSIFDESLLYRIARQMEKTLPSRSSPQFLHRLNTNTFYCCYLSAKKAKITTWSLEYPYENQQPLYGEGANRSDGCLETDDGRKYFVEQDNRTQRSAVINEKINKYILADVFSSVSELEKNTLVFCMDVKLSEQKWKELRKKDSMRLYRLSLKILKLWHLLEHIRGKELYLKDILMILKQKDDKTAVECLFTDKESEEAVRLITGIKNLKEADISCFEQFKDNCRKLGMEEREKNEMLGSAFEKRCRDLYLALPEISENEALRNRLIKGMRIYLLPLHDMKTQQPHLLLKEFQMVEEYLKCLTCMGLDCSEQKLKFKSLYELRNLKEEVWFRNVFVWPDLLAVWEDISADIGGHYRISRFLRLFGSWNMPCPLLFVLLVRNEKEAIRFYEAHETEISRIRKRNVLITFFSKDKLFFQNLMLSPYGIRRRNGAIEVRTVFLEADKGRLVELWEDEL